MVGFCSCSISVIYDDELLAGLGIKKLVFSSTCAIYGAPPRNPITEDLPARPMSPYSRTKYIMEQALIIPNQADVVQAVMHNYIRNWSVSLMGWPYMFDVWMEK